MANLDRLKFYNSAIDANRDKQILAENGIESWIANEQTIQSDWLLSQALGGIELQVFENEKISAEEILKEFYENESENLEVEYKIENPAYDFVCPRCGSNHLYRDENPGGVFGISLLLFSIPLKVPSNLYHCYHCGNAFKH